MSGNQRTQTTVSGNNNKEGNRILHLKEIRDLNQSKIGNEVTAKLLKLGCKLVFEVNPNGGLDTRVVSVKTGVDFCTYDDFDRTFSIGSLLREILEKTGTGGPGEKVIERIAAWAVRKNLAEQTFVLPGNKAQAGILANHIKNLESIEEAFATQKMMFKGHPLVVDFSNMIDLAYVLLGQAHLSLSGTKEVSLSKDVYPSLSVELGLPAWFLDQVKSPRDFVQGVASNKPYRLFFQPKGKGSITLKTMEWSNPQIFKNFPNVLVNSVFMIDLVSKIQNRADDDIKTIIPYSPDAADEAILMETGWPVVPNNVDVTDFLDQKSKRKTCEMVPWGSSTYKSCIERVRIALVRVLFLETSRIEDNGPFWTRVAGADVVQEPGIRIYETAGKVSDLQEKVNDFWKFATKRTYKGFTEVFASSLTSFTGGPLKLAIGRVFDDLPVLNKLVLNQTTDDTNVAKYENRFPIAEDGKAEAEAIRDVSVHFSEANSDYEVLMDVYGRESNHPKFLPDNPDKGKFWASGGAESLVPELTTDEKTKYEKFVKDTMKIAVIDVNPRILPSHPLSKEAREYLKVPDNRKMLMEIDKQAQQKLTKLLLSFNQPALQMDVAATVIGTIDRFKKGLLGEEDDPKEEEEANLNALLDDT